MKYIELKAYPAHFKIDIRARFGNCRDFEEAIDGFLEKTESMHIFWQVDPQEAKEEAKEGKW